MLTSDAQSFVSDLYFLCRCLISVDQLHSYFYNIFGNFNFTFTVIISTKWFVEIGKFFHFNIEKLYCCGVLLL